MLIAIVSFLAGLFFAPILRPFLKPLFMETVKVAYLATEEVKRAAAKAKEDMADAVATAEAEQKASKKSPHKDGEENT
jgi:hypothetical protein